VTGTNPLARADDVTDDASITDTEARSIADAAVVGDVTDDASFRNGIPSITSIVARLLADAAVVGDEADRATLGTGPCARFSAGAAAVPRVGADGEAAFDARVGAYATIVAALLRTGVSREQDRAEVLRVGLPVLAVDDLLARRGGARFRKGGWYERAI